MSTRRSSLHYVGIAVAVFVGVVAARLVVDYIEAQVVIGQIEKLSGNAVQDMHEIQERTHRKLAEQRAAAERQRRSSAEAVQEQRRTSQLGRDLYRRCVEFMRFYEENPGDYALKQRDETCKRYRLYIETGHRET